MTKPQAAISLSAIVLFGTVLAATLPAAAQNESVPSLRPQQSLPSGNSAQPGSPDDSLTHQLSRSRGVIKPPPTPDANVVTPPNQNSLKTPVIAPPGTPGGDPAVVPK
jgi:hypothetical protein